MTSKANPGFQLNYGATRTGYQLPERLRSSGSGGGLANIFSSISGGSWELGTTVRPKARPASVEGVAKNTAQVDGSSDFLNKLSGFGEDLLRSIGGRPERETMVQPASFGGGGGGGGGIDVRMLAMIGVAGAVVYYAVKS